MHDDEEGQAREADSAVGITSCGVEYISREALFAGYSIDRPEEEHLIEGNAEMLLLRVNALLQALEWPKPVRVNSGFRTVEHNRAIGGARNSLHTWGRAVDISDPMGALYSAIKKRFRLLRVFSLWMEAGTKGWVHLDTGVRLDRDVRIFRK